MRLVDVKAFAVAFYQAMGDRDVHLAAYRQLGIGLAVAAYVLAIAVLSQKVG